MIVVVEGTDNAGKTTLALSLAKQLKAIYVKSENIPPERHFLRQYHQILACSEAYGNGLVISDRHHAVSDPIYGPIVRGHTKLTSEDVEYFLEKVGGFIYCRPSNKIITQSMNQREQMKGVSSNIEEIIQAYDQFFLKDHIRERTWRHDWTKDSEQDLIAEIKRHARFS